jgi:hypothetical protein
MNHSVSLRLSDDGLVMFRQQCSNRDKSRCMAMHGRCFARNEFLFFKKQDKGINGFLVKT